MDFQSRVTAWVAAHILAGRNGGGLWGWPRETTLDLVRCETEQPVDDLMVVNSDGGFALAQVKTGLSVSADPAAPFGAAIDQVVRQYVASQSRPAEAQPVWMRRLDPMLDRILIITGPNAPASIRQSARRLLNRLRDQGGNVPLRAIPANATEEKILSVLLKQVAQAWSGLTGHEPSEDESRTILSLLRVESLELVGDGRDAAMAMRLLEQNVLADARQSQLAWSVLMDTASTLMQGRSGADRRTLANALSTRGVRIATGPDYRSDVKALRQHSRMFEQLISDFAVIKLGQSEIALQRNIAPLLISMADSNNVLVVGEPGAGKSGAVSTFVATLAREGRDFVLLPADRIVGASLDGIRSELGLEHQLSEVLQNWHGDGSAFLVIDALDAARAEPSARALRDLIHQVIDSGSRWRVVASVRKFDLRYSPTLQDLFRGAGDNHIPEALQDPEFVSIKHLNVPRLTPEEMSQLATRGPLLNALVKSSPPELVELLRIPFNLRLIAELLDTGVALQDLVSVKSQLDLLDRYWLRRVISEDGRGDAREAILRTVCDDMVAARQLRTDRPALTGGNQPEDLLKLLSSHVLVEWQPSPRGQVERQVVAFAHHILFDYAVARLLFRGATDKLAGRLQSDPELALVVRPSIQLHYAYLWSHGERSDFWDVLFRVTSNSSIPLLARLIGPSVLADSVRSVSELEPLSSLLASPESNQRETAEEVLRHMVSWLLALPSNDRLGSGSQAALWAELMATASEHLTIRSAFSMKALLSKMTERPADLASSPLRFAGQAARRLLQFAWQQPVWQQALVLPGIQSVCRTIASDPDASVQILRQGLQPEHVARYGFEEIFWLAEEAKTLVRAHPGLVREIFNAAYSYQETRKDPTPMGSSRILALTTTPTQNFMLARYALTGVLPDLLAASFQDGLAVVTYALESFIRERGTLSGGIGEERTFDFHEHVARIAQDNSYIWDVGDHYRIDEALKMLDLLDQYVEGRIREGATKEELSQYLNVLVAHNRLACLWRHLLQVGTRYPDALAPLIRPLAWSLPVLTCVDTVQAVGEFIKVIFLKSDSHVRRRIEEAIILIPKAMPEDQSPLSERLRDRLLGCLDPATLTTPEASDAIESLAQSGRMPANTPLFDIGQVTRTPYTEDDYLAEQGVRLEEEGNRRIRQLAGPVADFARTHLNSVPTRDEIDAVITNLRDLLSALQTDAPEMHLAVRHHAWGDLTAASAAIARSPNLPCSEGVATFVRQVLLAASRHDLPTAGPDSDARFDQSPGWGAPAPRVDAASGLMSLASNPDCMSEDLLNAVSHLAIDPHPAVRLQVALRLASLASTANEQMWILIENQATIEASAVVKKALITGPLSILARTDPNRVRQMTVNLYNRLTMDSRDHELRSACLSLIAYLYVWLGDAAAGERLLALMETPDSRIGDATHLPFELRETLTFGSVESPNRQADLARQRAFEVLQRLVTAATSRLADLQTVHRGEAFESLPAGTQEAMRSYIELLENVTGDLYFASGAFKGASNPRELSELVRRRFYRESFPLVEILTGVGTATIAHHLLEMLETFIDFDPEPVFLTITRVVESGRQGLYQYESMGADLVVRLIERYIAEYRDLLQRSASCRQGLLDVLNTFVEAGWPSAHRLTYRLEEAFR